ncbi:Oidioi.mRNA.OKI2018_I69.chr2.g6592.t1.cds [Oikopleura dioica]|uniref:Oidioi.mRNA.OKI2018_I69.chr2.g6592.t1.cds n=1 Tax=Oikopleura dioica TaxID=34765 RepID=A0ABN7T4H6_OIKDI|nr:Oidioi.mRNA.OKI2018_I69.chr2.g6592.t1.cds [Oikopleura dioica]
MRSKFYIFTLCGLAGVYTQSTNVNPPGMCAGYINKYTHSDQCVYSFTVPKRDVNDCKGLEDTVNNMNERTNALELEVAELKKIIEIIKDNMDANRMIGQMQQQQATWEENDRIIREENAMKSAQLTEMEINLREVQNNLERANADLAALKSEATPLEEELLKSRSQTQQFRNELVIMTQKYTDQLSLVDEMMSAKNCSEINKNLPSCDAIRLWGFKKSGYMMIDPDGEDGNPPFQVYCDMDSIPGRGITHVHHSNQGIGVDVQGCEEAGCFSHELNYQGVSMSQMESLIDIHTACEQSLRYDCLDSKIMRDRTAWWVSRDGRRQNSWGGAPIGSGKCACGLTNTCVDPNYYCNCDADDEKWHNDEGLIYEKDLLPIKEVRYGDVTTDKGEKGKSLVGALVCKWDKTMAVTSCQALARDGVRESGHYMIDPDGPHGVEPPQKVFCDFSNGIMPIDDSVDPTTVVEGGGLLPPAPVPSNVGPRRTWEFNDCGASGRFGPTESMCKTVYDEDYPGFFVKSGMQFFYAPKTGRYRITATAPGGLAAKKGAGKGASMSAIFKLEEETELRIIVGQKGSISPNREFFGGSGGTFVVKFASWVHEALVVAGGGGSAGAKDSSPNPEVTDANLKRQGKDASKTGASFGLGGAEGQGGLRGNRAMGTNTPGGGAGMMGNGQPSGDSRWGTPEPAISFTNNGEGNEAPGVGGTFFDASGEEIDGGFGGGGSGARWAAGGAGGYSGGGGGPDEGVSGGGGSYINDEGESPKSEVTNEGLGSVVIELLS